MNVNVSIIYFSLLVLIQSTGWAQITAQFSTSTNVCIDQNVDFTNTSSNATSYEWDFCSGDLLNTPTSTFVGSFSGNPYSHIALNEDGNWYAFLVLWGDNELVRLDYGSSLDNTPTEVSLGNPGSFFDTPQGMTMIQNDAGDWFGFVVNQGADNVIRLNFGNSLSNSPNADDLGNFGSQISNPDGVEAVFDGDYKVIVSSGAKISILDFSTDISSSPTYSSFNVATASRLWGVSLLEKEGNWYGIASDFSASKVFHLSFGTEVTTTVTENEIDISSLGLSSYRDITFVEEGAAFYGFIITRNADLIELDFGDDPSSITPVLTNFGDIDPSAGNNSVSISITNYQSEWIGFMTDFGNRVVRIDFPNTCDTSTPISTQENPTNISFTSDGTYATTLKAFNVVGQSSSASTDITVSSSVAPSITFSVDDSRCIANTNTFTPSITGLTAYSWDFDDDGIEDSDLENPPFDYSILGAGTYTVRLDVDDGACSNYYESEITIYEEPPVPVVTPSTTDGCTNASITFTNSTDESQHVGIISYAWDFDNDGIVDSTDPSPSFTYTTTGSKTVSVVSSIPGCESAATEINITISEGPSVDFTWVNNCLGGEIDFINNSTGDSIVSYNWDFDDGNFSTSFEPSHTYASTGTYDVELTVANATGCVTVFSREIEVSNADLAIISIINDQVNEVVQLNGIDNTASGDDVIGWTWNVEGVEIGTSQNVSTTFSALGTYSVDLMVSTSQGCMQTINQILTIVEADAPTTSFAVVTDACIDQELEFTNSTINATSYNWDFCTGDLELVPTLEEIDDVSAPYSHVLIRDGNWFGFTISRGDNNLMRYSYGNSIFNTPTSDVIENPSDLLNTPHGFDIIYDGDSFYGFVANQGTSDIVRLDFGSSLMNTPSATSLGDFSGLISGPDYLRIVYDGEGYKGLVSSGGDLVILDFGTDVSSNPSTSSISGYSRLWGIGLVENESNWYGLWSDFSDDKVYHASFGDMINSSPSITEIDVSSLGLSGFRGTDFIKEGAQFYGFVISDDGNLMKMEFGTDPSSTSPTISNMGDIDPDVSNTSIALRFHSDSSRWAGFVTDFAGTINRLRYENECDMVDQFSSDFEPNDVSFGQSGTYLISLTAFDANGNSSTNEQSIAISTSTSPSITFSLYNVCVSADVIFSPSTTGLSSYSWDLDGDGIEDSNLESPVFDYSGLGAGTYSIRVDVNDGTCTNFYEEEITIYNPPPVPSYDVSAARYCIGADITFSNTTDDATYTGPLTYTWEFIDDATTTTVGTSNESNPTFAFAAPGTKTVILTSSIPGCEEVVQQSITINPSPTANFTSTSVCQNESMQFTNTSVNADTYQWDFGDGFTSTAVDPNHVYTAAGNYSVSLTATDANGCDQVIVQEVAVAATPVPEFDFDLPCTLAEGIQFFDMTTVENADVVSWRWEVDGVEQSTSQNPVLDFGSAGIKTIALTTVSSNGCESYYAEDIEILPAPQPDFEVQIGCQGEITTFSDNTIVDDRIISWQWLIDGEEYNEESIEHVFEGPGIYDITLEVTGQNFCSESITKPVEILQLPEVNFAIDGSCDNEIIFVNDQSQEFDDAIISRTWLLDNNIIGNGEELLLSNVDEGSYTLTLELETTSGCITSFSEALEINQSPTAAITASRSYGLPSDTINFTNTSQGATNYVWLLNEAAFSLNSDAETVSFSEVGTHVVSLVAQNSLGCSDTVDQEILIAIPEVDLAIGNLELIEENSTGRIFLEVENNSNLPVEITQAEIVLENQFAITEEIEQFIAIGQRRQVRLNVGVPLTNGEPAYLCVRLTSQYVDFPDIDPINNEKCINVEQQTRVEDPFPNPVTDRFRLKVISPMEGTATLSLINSAGKIRLKDKFWATTGLNNFFVDMTALDPGIYFVTIELNGTTFKRKVIKL